MTREEAINEIKSWAIPSKKGREVLETLIPELCESEDERIRKALIDEIKVWDEDYKLFKHISKEKVLAYLEKQKKSLGDDSKTSESEDELTRQEMITVIRSISSDCLFAIYLTNNQKQRYLAYLEKIKDASYAIEAVERIDKYIDEHVANAHDMKDSNPDKKYYRGWDDALGEMARILQDVYSEGKQKEPKIDAHENDFTSKDKSEDEGMCKRAIAILKQQRDFWSYDGPTEKFPPATLRKDLVDAIDAALSYLERQKEQDGEDEEATPCSVDEFTLTLRNCLSTDSELTKEQADIFATVYGKELFNVAIGKVKSGLTKEDIADFKIEKQKEQKSVEPSDDELQRHQDELYAFKVFAAKQAKEHHISFVHDFEWNNFCAGLLSYFNEKQKPEQYDIDVLEKHITKDSVSELAHTVIVRNGWEIVEKEQKPVPIKMDDKRMLERIMELVYFCNDKEKIWNWLCEKVKETAEWDELQTEFRSINEAFEDGKKEVIEHPERYGLQKPTEWSEEDKQWLSDVYFAIDHSMYSEDERQAMKKYIDYLRLQPKQEWSDDTIRKAVKEVGLTQHQIDWFKTNVFPPKQEWSEDERIRKELIGMINECTNWAHKKEYITYLEKQKERKDYNKLYEDIAKSEWFKKAYEGKSLGGDNEQGVEDCECDKETITQKAYREGQNAGRQEVFDNPWAYGLEKIDNVFGFRIGDKVRLVDGDGRPHIIKYFEKIEGLHGPDFYRAIFEDNTASDHIIPGDEYPNGYFTCMEKIDEQKEQKPVKKQ